MSDSRSTNVVAPRSIPCLSSMALARRRCASLVHDRLGENRCGGGAVTSHVVGLGGGFLEEPSHVRERVLELDLLGDGAVKRDGRGAVLLVERDAGPWAERGLDCIARVSTPCFSEPRAVSLNSITLPR